MAKRKEKLGFLGAWSMSVGGMIGGGIFAVLGVVMASSGQYAWLSFVIAGLIGLISAHSYAQLSVKFGESGGAFIFLRRIGRKSLGGSLALALILGYILAISVYGFTLGHYLAHSLDLGAWFPRAIGLVVIAALIWVNLLGVGESETVEIVTVIGKIVVLVGLAVIGLAHWNPDGLSQGVQLRSAPEAFVGAATIFLAYEGFQLLAYDYDEIENAPKNLPRAAISSVITVIITYVLVAIGAAMLVSAGTIVEHKEVSLAAVGEAALGKPGLFAVALAAALSTGSAINATLFSTARLMEDVAQRRELPNLLARQNRSQVPWVAVVTIGVFGGVLAAFGNLTILVEAASLMFLLTFGLVNLIAFRQKICYRYFCLLGALGAAIAAALSTWRLYREAPWTLAGLIMALLVIAAVRPLLVRNTDST